MCAYARLHTTESSPAAIQASSSLRARLTRLLAQYECQCVLPITAHEWERVCVCVILQCTDEAHIDFVAACLATLSTHAARVYIALEQRPYRDSAVWKARLQRFLTHICKGATPEYITDHSTGFSVSTTSAESVISAAMRATKGGDGNDARVRAAWQSVLAHPRSFNADDIAAAAHAVIQDDAYVYSALVRAAIDNGDDGVVVCLLQQRVTCPSIQYAALLQLLHSRERGMCQDAWTWFLQQHGASNGAVDILPVVVQHMQSTPCLAVVVSALEACVPREAFTVQARSTLAVHIMRLPCTHSDDCKDSADVQRALQLCAGTTHVGAVAARVYIQALLHNDTHQPLQTPLQPCAHVDHPAVPAAVSMAHTIVRRAPCMYTAAAEAVPYIVQRTNSVTLALQVWGAFRCATITSCSDRDAASKRATLACFLAMVVPRDGVPSDSRRFFLSADRDMATEGVYLAARPLRRVTVAVLKNAVCAWYTKRQDAALAAVMDGVPYKDLLQAALCFSRSSTGVYNEPQASTTEHASGHANEYAGGHASEYVSAYASGHANASGQLHDAASSVVYNAPDAANDVASDTSNDDVDSSVSHAAYLKAAKERRELAEDRRTDRRVTRRKARRWHRMVNNAVPGGYWSVDQGDGYACTDANSATSTESADTNGTDASDLSAAYMSARWHADSD